MSLPRLLDLFCGAGGCSMGYSRAGFEVVGVDKNPQPNYPFEFHQNDALEFLAARGEQFDAIHASPPCQKYSTMKSLHKRSDHPDLVGPVRDILTVLGRPWVIENVVGSPLRPDITLCGLMFGLKVFRHRHFESSFFLAQPPHPPHGNRRIGLNGFCTVVGKTICTNNRQRELVRKKALEYARNGGKCWVSTEEDAKNAMGINWMTRYELTQAIPPAYTQFIGVQLLPIVLRKRIL